MSLSTDLPVASGIAPNAQEVVANLKGGAQRRTRAADGGAHVRVVAGEDGAEFHGGADQRRGFAINHVEIGVHRHRGLVLEGHVQILAFGHAPAAQRQDFDGVAHGPGVAGIARPQHAERGRDVHEIAGVDGHGGAPDRPHRGPVTPQPVVVHHVVMHQREVVQQLDTRRRRQGGLDVAAERLAREQAQGRAQRLAAICASTALPSASTQPS